MKKILVVLVFVIVAACLVAPKFIAPKHQEKVVELVGKLDKTPGYSAEILSTDSAWFGSENTVRFSFDVAQIDPSLEEEKVEVELVIDTHYGPLLFSNQGLFGLYATDLRIEGDTLRNLLSWDESAPLYQLSVLGGFTGNIKVADTAPSFSNLENTIQFSGYAGKGEMTSTAFSYEGALKEVKVEDAYSPLKAEGFTLSIELNADLATILQGGFYDSTIDFSLDTLSLNPNTQLSGLNIEMGSNLDQATQLGNIEISYGVKDVVADDFKASDLILVTQLDKLSNQFFIDYKNFSDNFPADSGSYDDVYEALFIFMQDNIGELLAANPEFNVPKFSGTFPEGRFSANLTSTLAEVGTPTMEELSMPEFWLYHAIVTANIETDQTLLTKFAERFVASQMRAPLNAPEVKQQALMIVESLVQQGFIKLEDTKYRSQITIENGQGKVFDMSFPLM